MFQNLTLHGSAASLLWGYRTAAVLTSWAIRKKQDGGWTLTATVGRIDAFQARQRPLMFTAPRAGGFWSWPVLDIQLGAARLSATLGPPEQ